MHHLRNQKQQGISLIEIVIAFAVTALFLASTLPALQHQTIRARVSLGLDQAAQAQGTLASACTLDRGASIHQTVDGRELLGQADENAYVSHIRLQADCLSSRMIVEVWTRGTGAAIDPVLQLVAGDPADAGSWECLIVRGQAAHAPARCRAVDGDARPLPLAGAAWSATEPAAG
jgi:type IV pilus assembly protein PilA